jgi:hypothetical protein
MRRGPGFVLRRSGKKSLTQNSECHRRWRQVPSGERCRTTWDIDGRGGEGDDLEKNHEDGNMDEQLEQPNNENISC